MPHWAENLPNPVVRGGSPLPPPGSGAGGAAVLTDTPAPPPELLVASHFRQDGRYAVRRAHGAPSWLLTYTTGGAGVYRLGERTWPARPGDLWLVAPGTPQDYRTDPVTGLWDFWWVHFRPRPTWTEWLRWPALADGLLHRHLEGGPSRLRVQAAWERLVADARGTGGTGEELALCGLEEILLVARDRARREAAPAADGRVRVALEYAAAHLGEHHSLPALAARVALSPSRLAHVCKAQTGQSPMRAVTALRLREAARLLEFTDQGVAEVARDLGFDSPSHFSRRFTAAFGLSPRAWRASRRT